MIVKWSLRACVTVLLAATLTACGAGSPSGSSTPTATDTSVSASESSDAAAWQAKVKADDQAAQKRANGIEARVKATSSLDARLSLIVTEYCKALQASAQADEISEDVARLLEPMYDKYWSAGTKWDTPLHSAAKQQGGCPDAVKAFDIG